MQVRGGRSGTYVRTRSGLQKKSRVTAYVLVSAFFLLGVVWFVCVSHYFSVQSLQVEGIKELSREEVEHATYTALDRGAWKPWDQRNLLFINTSEVASEVQRELFAENVTVDKIYPNVLRLIIRERQRRVVYVRNGQYLVLDTDGFITDGGVDTAYVQSRLSGKTFADASHPVIIVQLATDPIATSTNEIIATTTTATNTSRLTDDSTVKTWLDASEAIIASGIKFKVLEVMDTTSRSLNIVTDKGYTIIVDTQSDLKPQIETYLKFIQTKTKDMVIHEYIDARAPGKVYFK